MLKRQLVIRGFCTTVTHWCTIMQELSANLLAKLSKECTFVFEKKSSSRGNEVNLALYSVQHYPCIYPGGLKGSVPQQYKRIEVQAAVVWLFPAALWARLPQLARVLLPISTQPNQEIVRVFLLFVFSSYLFTQISSFNCFTWTTKQAQKRWQERVGRKVKGERVILHPVLVWRS